MQNTTTLKVQERPEGVLLVTLDRPELANAFDTRTALALTEAFLRPETEPRWRCVVLTGSGKRGFCAGADLKERNSLTEAQWLAQHEVFERLFRSVRDCRVPVIAAVNGAAVGVGAHPALRQRERPAHLPQHDAPRREQAAHELPAPVGHGDVHLQLARRGVRRRVDPGDAPAPPPGVPAQDQRHRRAGPHLRRVFARHVRLELELVDVDELEQRVAVLDAVAALRIVEGQKGLGRGLKNILGLGQELLYGSVGFHNSMIADFGLRISDHGRKPSRFFRNIHFSIRRLQSANATSLPPLSSPAP